MKEIAAFNISINYTQIAVFRPEEWRFFEYWTGNDGVRGYQIRDGHICFGVEDHDDLCDVTVLLAGPENRSGRQSLSLRAGEDGLNIETIMDIDRPAIRVDAGDYLVWFGAMPKQPEGLTLTFVLSRLLDSEKRSQKLG